MGPPSSALPRACAPASCDARRPGGGRSAHSWGEAVLQGHGRGPRFARRARSPPSRRRGPVAPACPPRSPRRAPLRDADASLSAVAPAMRPSAPHAPAPPHGSAGSVPLQPAPTRSARPGCTCGRSSGVRGHTHCTGRRLAGTRAGRRRRSAATPRRGSSPCSADNWRRAPECATSRPYRCRPTSHSSRARLQRGSPVAAGGPFVFRLHVRPRLLRRARRPTSFRPIVHHDEHRVRELRPTHDQKPALLGDHQQRGGGPGKTTGPVLGAARERDGRGGRRSCAPPYPSRLATAHAPWTCPAARARTSAPTGAPCRRHRAARR